MGSCMTDLCFTVKGCERTLELWDRKSLSVESSVGAWKIRTLRAVQRMEVWLVKFQREVQRLLGHLCEESVVLVSWH